MDEAAADAVFRLLRRSGIAIGPGLSPEEFEHAERTFALRFPPDLRLLLGRGLPIGPKFPAWRTASDKHLREMIRWPLDGILFEVRAREFWPRAWGRRPRDYAAAKRIASAAVAVAPALVPVYSHRYLPSEPYEAGNPVLSVYQSDVAYYGRNLSEYFANEFGSPRTPPIVTEVGRIRFWSDLAEGTVDRDE